MSNVAANSIFAREDQLNLFISIYLAWRHSNGAGASQPNAWGPPVLARPPMRSMSPRNLCANSRQALPGTDDGASQPANPSKAAEQKREEWPGLWRLTLEWRKIVAPSYSVQASPCRKRQCTQTSIPTRRTQRSRGKRQCRRQAVTTTEPPMTSAADKICRLSSPWRGWTPTGTADLRGFRRVPVCAAPRCDWTGQYGSSEVANAGAEARDRRYYTNQQDFGCSH